MVMVSPLVPPLALIVGVVSLVLLSESDAPESDDANRSTPVGADGGVVSIVSDNDPVAGLVFPAASVTEADTVHVPSDNVGNEQLVAAPTVYVHVTVEVPFVADTVTSSPVRAPGIEISGVESLVMLSELDAPLSDVANKSGADREGGLVAIVTGRALDASDSLPNGSVNVAEMFHVPSVSVGSVQLVAVPITYVHDTVVAPLVAEMVMVSPFAPPVALKVGVLSPVKLSESDEPVSDVANKSRPVGANGAVPSIVMGSADEEVEMLPDGSVNVDETFHVPSVSVGSVQFVADPMT
jgi:hypothetical protein